MFTFKFSIRAPLSEAGIGALGSAAQGAAGLITGIIGARNNLKAQRETNQMNYKIAQMNNDFNVKMMERQMDYNTEMWNKSNDYNSASSQVQRLRDAGLNPYLMMNGGSAGSAANAMGINTPTATPVTMQAPDNGLANVAGYISQMANPIGVFADLKQRLADANVADQTQDDRILTAQLQNDALRASTSLTIAQKLKTDIDIQWLPQQYSLMCSDYSAGIALKYAQGELTRKQAKHEVEKIAETVARIANIKKDTDIKDLQLSLERAVFDYRVEREKYEAQYWRNNSGFKPSGWADFFAGIMTNPGLIDSFTDTIQRVKKALGFDYEFHLPKPPDPPKRKDGQSSSSYFFDYYNSPAYPKLR